MGDAGFEEGAGRIILIHVDRIKIAGNIGETGDIVFGHGFLVTGLHADFQVFKEIG